MNKFEQNFMGVEVKNTTPDAIAENKNENINPYRAWQEKMIKGGEYNAGKINEISYIKFAIEKGEEKDLDEALRIAEGVYRERRDLISDIYIKKGDLDEARRIIINVDDPTLYDVMAGPINNIKKINPDLAVQILNNIKSFRDQRYFNALRTEFFTEEIE